MLVRISPDGSVLAVSTADESSVRLVDARTGRSLRELTGHADDPLALAFSPNGRRIATLSLDRTVIVWDVASGEDREHLDLSEPATSLAFAPGGRTLYTAGPDRAIRAWDLEGSRRYVARVRKPSGFSYGLIIPAPGGDFIAIASGGSSPSATSLPGWIPHLWTRAPALGSTAGPGLRTRESSPR